MVAGMGVVLNGANLYGYVRCKMGSPKKLPGAASNFLGQQVLGSVSEQCYCGYMMHVKYSYDLLLITPNCLR